MSWKDRLHRYIRAAMPIEEAYRKSYRFRGNEPGFVHPVTHASVRMRDDGAIDIFAGEHLGIRLDPNAQSVNIFADKFNVWSSTTSIHTDRNHLLWNYMPLNPQIPEMQDRVDRDNWPRVGPYEGQRRYFKGLYEYEEYICEIDDDGNEVCGWELQSPRYRPYLRDQTRSMITIGTKKLNEMLEEFEVSQRAL